ncbi:hypothetical protein PF008_g11279 [Phytophthora fragariae]|uniref:Retrotransposon gag domain-containing protein n=1 Tax=Phytophthora fragariae TaxID=53985 RepID=A0A6G0RRB6_9STRA|nr:hypothetical protein PF008_g11279 [Phytophthora fragariae]
MPKFIDGGPKDFLEWVYHFKQLTATKHWSAEDKFLNTSLLLEGDLRDAFEYESITDGDVRMEDEFWHALHAASKVVLPVGYSENLQEELWEIKKSRAESLADCSKRFRALARMEKTLTGLSENSAMGEDALCRLFKRGLSFEWQNKYDASGQVYSTVAALAPFFECIEQGEQRLHRAPSTHGQERRNSNNRSNSRNNWRNNSYNRHNNSHHHSNNNRQQPRGGNRGRGNADGNGNNSSSDKYCTFHRTTTHNTQDCRALQQNRQHEEHQQADHQRRSSARQYGEPANNQQTHVEQRGHGPSDEERVHVRGSPQSIVPIAAADAHHDQVGARQITISRPP